MDEFATWKPIPPEELAEMKEGEPVVVLISEYRAGKRLNYYREGNFRCYDWARGIVLVDFPFGQEVESNLFLHESSYCDANVGRCGILEHEELHTAAGEYEE